MSSGLFASASFGPTPRLRRPTTGSNAAHEPHFIGNPTQELSNSSCLCEDLHEPRSSSIMLAKCACSNRAEDIFSPTCKANSLIDAFFNVKLVSIIDTVFSPYLVVLFLLLWGVILWRLRTAWTGRPNAQHYLCALEVGVLAYLGWTSRWVSAWGFAVFVFTWSMLPETKSLDGTNPLPTFEAFLKQLREPRPTAGNPTITEADGDDGGTSHRTEDTHPDCIVCWSSDEAPKELPCKHLLCISCLTSIKERHQHQCPLCRTPLFSSNEGALSLAYKLLASTYMTNESLRVLLLALYIYKGKALSWNTATEVGCFFASSGMLLQGTVMIQNFGSDWWKQPAFDYSVRLGKRGSRELWQPVAWLCVLMFTCYSMYSRLGEADVEVMSIKLR